MGVRSLRGVRGVRGGLVIGVGIVLSVLVPGCGRSSVAAPPGDTPGTDSPAVSAAGPSASAGGAASEDRTSCVKGVLGIAFQRTEPDGSHSAAVQLRPCPAGTAQKYPLGQYATLSFLGASGVAAVDDLAAKSCQ